MIPVTSGRSWNKPARDASAAPSRSNQEAIVRRFIEDNHQRLEMLGDSSVQNNREMIQPLKWNGWRQQAETYRPRREMIQNVFPTTRDARVDESEYHDADEGVTVSQVERQPRLEQRGWDRMR